METTASTITTSNILKRPCEDTLLDHTLHKRLHTADEDENGAGQAVLESVEAINADIYETLAEAEREKERIQRECTEAVQKRLAERAESIAQVPGFWSAALRQSRAKDYLTEDDEKLLDHLMVLDLLEPGDGSLQVTLRFSDENPYLETPEITRLVSAADPTIATQVTPVAWKPGQELSPPTDESGAGAFDSCNFFQRIAYSPQFDVVDSIIYAVYWDPLKYYRGAADLDAERHEWELQQMEMTACMPEEEDASDEEDADEDGADADGDIEGEDDQIAVAQEEEEEEEPEEEEDGDDDAL